MQSLTGFGNCKRILELHTVIIGTLTQKKRKTKMILWLIGLKEDEIQEIQAI